MIRLLARLILNLLANTVGLIAASLILPGFSIDALSLIVDVIIFSAVTTLVGPLLLKIAIQNIPALTGGIAFVTTFAGLLVTDILTDGLTIDGAATWLMASIIVWLFALLAGIILPIFLFKKTLEKRNSAN
jgi:putative membrane protein